MSKIKEYNKTKLTEAIQLYSDKYDSLLHKSKTGSPTEQQPTNPVQESTRNKPIGSLTEEEFREQYTRQYRVF